MYYDEYFQNKITHKIETWDFPSSLSVGLSAAMLPSAATDCSTTFFLPDFSSLINLGTAPAFTTALVCSEVPPAIIVRTHAASN